MENGKAGLPSEVSIWSKIRSFLFKEIEITDTELALTPKQEKVFQEVHDFWHQEITAQDVNNVLTHEITWQSTKDFWLQKIDITL